MKNDSKKKKQIFAENSTFVHVLQGRYPSKDMKVIWSKNKTTKNWRRMWIEIARAEMELGISVITQSMIDEMEANIENINYVLAQVAEKKRRHDVMAHVETYAHACPGAANIIHLGCTSCEITDNAELMTIKESLQLIAVRLATGISHLVKFADKWKYLPTLAFTHFQDAQPTTVGKRACMWIQDLLMDLLEVEMLIENLRFRGIKGTVGTQASFLELFNGDHEKVRLLDKKVTRACGFKSSFIITGQTYTRKQDTKIIGVLASLGASLHKIGTDIRLLANKKEIEEPFEPGQDGSSAMPYKRNPMLDERMCSISRHLMNLFPDANDTHAVQWLERTLDDSAIRRIFLSEAFLCTDAVLMILQKVFQGIIVYPKMIEKHLNEALPFMASENIIANMVNAGGNRQEVHGRIKNLSQEAGRQIKEEGLGNNLIGMIMKDEFFAPIHENMESILNSKKFIGRAPELVNEFLFDEVYPVLDRYKEKLDGKVEINV